MSLRSQASKLLFWRRTDQRTATVRDRFYRSYWHAVAEAVGAELATHDNRWLELRLGKGARTSFWVRGQFLPIDDKVLLEVAAQKALSQRLLEREGLPIPRVRAFRRSQLTEALAFAGELGYPVVAKPVRGSSGRGVRTDLDTPESLRKALQQGFRRSADMLVEAQLEGASYRLLYLYGELVDVVERRPPSVIGDGRRTVRQLVVAENARRLEPESADLASYRGLSQVTLDGVSAADAVPADGARTPLKRAVNQNGRCDNSRVAGGVHDDFRELGYRIRRRLPIDLLGVDFISPDIGRSYREVGGINEINTTPAPHHHELIDNGGGIEIGAQAVQRWLQVRCGGTHAHAG